MTWLPIVKRVGYDVSDWGAILSRVHPSGTPTIIKQTVGTDGRLQVVISRKTVRVHIAVLETFVGLKSDPSLQACHFDGNPFNNCVENLYWGTAQDNADDREAHGKTARGSRSGASKFTEIDAKDILRLYGPAYLNRYERKEMGFLSQMQLSAKYGVSQTVISNLVLGKTWKSIHNTATGEPE